MDVKHLSAFQGFSAEKLQKHNVFKSGRFFLDGRKHGNARYGNFQEIHIV